MEIRKSQYSDIDSIMVVVSEAQEYFKNNGIDQWQDGYPNHDSFINDIDNQCSYVLIDNDKIIGTMYFTFDEDPCYRVIDGNWKTDYQYGVIHRIAVLSSYKGQGLASHMLDYAVKECMSNNIHSIRIDTHIDNLSMQKFLYKNGFELCGTITLESGASRIALEKIIE